MSQSNPLRNYQWVTGYNNAGTLVNVEAYTPTGSQTTWQLGGIYGDSYVTVRALPTYDFSLQATNGGMSQNGNATVQWVFSKIAYPTYLDIVSVYLVTGHGRLTVNTTGVTTAYTNQNAKVIQYTPPNQTRSLVKGGVQFLIDAVWTLELLGAPS